MTGSAPDRVVSVGMLSEFSAGNGDNLETEVVPIKN